MHCLSFVVVLAPFADLQPDIFEEERNEIVVHEDQPIRTQTLLRTFVDTNIKDVGDIKRFVLFA